MITHPLLVDDSSELKKFVIESPTTITFFLLVLSRVFLLTLNCGISRFYFQLLDFYRSMYYQILIADYRFYWGLCVSRPPALAPNLYLPALAPNLYIPALALQFVFTGPGPQFVFTGPGPQFVFTGPGPQFVFTGPGPHPRFVFTSPGQDFTTTTTATNTIYY